MVALRPPWTRSCNFQATPSSSRYALLETIRRIGLKGAEMARAQAGTLRRAPLRSWRRNQLLITYSCGKINNT